MEKGKIFLQTTMINTEGLFYPEFKEKNNYSLETKQCIENTLINLMKNDTTVSRPGMLLGKIQSGKTRTFIGITALAFDNDYDITIVLTKGTRALAQQTYERLKKEFEDFKDDDVLQIFDIMTLPDNLIDYELEQKLIFVVKKEANNLRRLQKALFETYPALANKKVLIIDDEADFASIGFSKTQQEIYEINVIAGLIDNIRKELSSADFLQVTATPYSLYLQPEDLKIDGTTKTFQPIKPAFTGLVPVPDAYIGGEYYFEESEEHDSIASHIYEPISSNELLILKKADGRRFKLEDVLTSNKISSLRHAIVNFIVGGSIRRIQDKKKGVRQKKYSFIVHTEQAKAAHEWQETIVTEIKDQLKRILNQNPILLNELIQESYEDLIKSLSLIESYIPSLEDVKYEVLTALSKDYLMITKVNSEKDITQLLDDSGQLKLRAPLNIFIGGQILDRGITIGNLIGFYYGRNPKTFQQDTVLQHSRMFGYRPIEDLSVTRFYTTNDIYDVMKKIHEFDSSLRAAFENGGQDKGVVFIQKDDKNKIIPCSPNKILLSKTTALKPLKRLLPVGFQTGYKSYISKTITEIDQVLEQLSTNDEHPFLIDVDQAITIIEKIKSTFAEDEGNQWDDAAFISSMEFLSNNTDSKHSGKVWCIVRKDRNISRVRKDDRFEDAPDTPTGQKSELRVAKQIATDIPALILLRQNGKEENGWRGCPFWWPVLVTPANTKTTIFTSKSLD
ncbi:Z1 domain-containing protein [Robertmurraya andreesenii]|uniref:Helicase ATP-binding domain-containing protein n=1 Tax=Anoxybacillus andreesenii TaxID=1325932 RepID=A0ABT9V6G1_9BACL|nr:Z1 domain-containing protein [Robertmurraya andreesenii]MDQ0156528.1 hypothetical protein [Robertmurraya andreesenii]